MDESVKRYQKLAEPQNISLKIYISIIKRKTVTSQRRQQTPPSLKEQINISNMTHTS